MDQFVAEIRMFGCSFAPKDWALCNGQLLAIRTNTALFSLIGTYYGGDGKTTFALPNLQGQAALGQGQAPGFAAYDIGETLGTETVTLVQSDLAIHNHNVNCFTDAGGDPSPANNILGSSGADRAAVMYSDATTGTTVQMSGNEMGMAGAINPLPHNNMSPYLVVNYCIALQGVFPSRP
ncbi:phage tail protein [Ferruginibacter sp.]